MTMRFICNTCGRPTDVPQWGAEDSASVSNDGGPPAGYRTIYTVIEEHDGNHGTAVQAGEVVHSCADCNSYMSVDEHLEAEYENRKARMWQPDRSVPTGNKD